MRNPRINVTLNADDAEMMYLLAEKKKVSVSSLANKMISFCLEEYEDTLLVKRAEEAEQKWEKAGKPTIAHEELWKRLNT